MRHLPRAPRLFWAIFSQIAALQEAPLISVKKLEMEDSLNWTSNAGYPVQAHGKAEPRTDLPFQDSR